MGPRLKSKGASGVEKGQYPESDSLSESLETEEAAPAEQPPPNRGMPAFDKMVTALFNQTPSAAKSATQVASSTPRATLPLPEGTVALEIPAQLSRKSFEALKSWVDVMVALTERSIPTAWYVEAYTPTSTKAEAVHNLGTWEDVKFFIATSHKANPDVIIRVIAPDAAAESELAELRAIGVRTF
jgi:hypothetical protein